MERRRVVITGLGVVACNGIGKEDFWKANMEGRSGVSAVTSFDVSKLDVKIAGQVQGFDPLKYMQPVTVQKTDRYVHFSLAASRMALEDSKIDLPAEDLTRVGVIMGSGLGGIVFHEELMMNAVSKGIDRIPPFSVPRMTPNSVTSHFAIQFGLLGPNMVISTACASGSHAIGEAFRKISYGDMDVCVTGGVEAPLTPFTFGAYTALRALSKHNDVPVEASRPFDKNRDGFVLAEGAGVVILEELNHALARGAHIYAELSGYAANTGAHHMVMPMPNGEDACRVMRGALKDANLNESQIDYINAHGTSTQANDKAETNAIKQVFGERAYRIPVSSTKSMIGHSIGAAGGIEAVVCALALENQFVPPTINYKEQDPECDLDYVPNQGRSAKLNHVVSNSFGFGSSNACLIFSKWSAKG
jgi:3-oxoacyl-[acyl-carrier-protein] synthase II